MLLLVPAITFGVGACGGSAFEGNAGSAGTSSHAGSGNSGAEGGSLGVSGSSNVGGTTSSGGSTSVGGTTSTAGTTSAGGTSSGGSGDISSCTDNSQCEVVPVSCCSCGTGSVNNYLAINSQYDTVYNQRCGAVDCAACPPIAYDPNNPVYYYVPTCQAGRCVIVDLKTTDITECVTATDCEVRAGTGCCSSCSGAPDVALNQAHASELSKLVCNQQGAPTGCPACAQPELPAGSLGCESGRCVINSGGTCTSTNPCPG